MFIAQRTLGFGDCDPSGIAYFPSYLDIMVSVVEEFFAAAGAPWSQMIAERRIGTPTVRLNITFSKPGFHGDALEFAIRLVKIGTSSMDLEHIVSARGEVLWRAEQRLVATSLETHGSCPWPDDIRAGFAPYLDSQTTS